jgi:eukaryotic-like serine/threonine-protein kinase
VSTAADRLPETDDDAAFLVELKEALRAPAPTPRVEGCVDLMEIGRGGQGVVYSAVQTSTRRKVAVKVLHDLPGRVRDARRRFARELEIVSRLRDPRLAQVFDGGETEDGRPFVVMEFVDGVPLLDAEVVRDARARGWAGSSRLPALALFAEICAAVEVAHRRGVIHRDLKPSNILVDERGSPRVLDFGLAKAAGLADDALSATANGSFLGSLPWTSPEQAEGRVDKVDVRSDVYSLGATLYHAVVGAPPVPKDAAPRAVFAAVVETPPARPSLAVPTIDRDLEAILLRALEKDPNARYATAADMARDLRAAALGEPIEARRASAWRALAAAARRRRRATIATAVLAVAAAFAAVVFWNQNRRIAAEAARAEGALDFVLDALGAVDPSREGAETKLVDALDAASATLDERLSAEDDARRLKFRRRLAELYATFGRFDRALAEGEAAATLANRIGFPRGSDEHRAYLRGEGARAVALRRLGRSSEAETLLAKTHESLVEAFGARDGAALDVLSERAQAARALGRLDEAAAFATSVLDATTAATDASDGLLARGFAFDTLAAIAEDRGDPQAAEVPAREALATLRRCGPKHEGQAIVALSNLGNLLLTLGKAEAAAELLESSLPRLDAAYGADHPTTLGVRHNLGAAWIAAGRPAEAVATLRVVYDKRREKLGADAAKTLGTLNELVVACSKAGLREETGRLARELFEARLRTKDRSPIDFFVAGNNLAAWLRDNGPIDEALSVHRSFIDEAIATLPSDHVELAVFRATFGRSLAVKGLAAEAAPHLRAALVVLEARLGPDHPSTKTVRSFLASLD